MEYPDWYVVGQANTVDIWWELFDYWHIDEDARMNLVALSQYSPEGYEHANSIIGQLLKKKALRVLLAMG